MIQKRLPVLHKFVSKSSNILKISIFLARMKKPMIPKFIFLKKSRKHKRLDFLKHNNYGFLGEYQFDSPLSSPLIHYYNRQHDKNKNRSIQDIYSMLLWSKCFGCLKDRARGEADCILAMEADLSPAFPTGGEVDSEVDQEGSVDEKAERFIERFYAEMRLQRQESF